MKSLRFFIYLILIVVIFDVLVGRFATQYVKTHTLPGDYKLIDYVINKCDAECIIVGNSLAINSLIPQVIEDSLGMTCYNAGASAQHIPYIETIMDCIIKRHKPKMIVFIFGPTFLSGTGSGQRYNVLVPYYHAGHELIDKNLESKGKLEPFLLKSSLYRFNKIWWRILLYHFISYSDKNEKGFIAHEKPKSLPEMYPLEYKKDSKEYEDCFMRCFELCKSNGIEMVCVAPPVFKTFDHGEPESVKFIREACQQNNVLFIDDTQDAYFLKNADLWYDNVHFNIDGSKLYTNQFIREFKSLKNK